MKLDRIIYVAWLAAVVLWGAVVATPPAVPARAGPDTTVNVAVPLIDAAALAAHADSAGVPRAGAYAIAWLETRDGRCLPRCPRGRGRLDGATGRRGCRAVGRMQINPCAGLDRGNPRCTFQRILTSLDDNYACALTYYATLRARYPNDEAAALAGYLGAGVDVLGTTSAGYARDALAFVGRLWLAGALTKADR